MPFWAKAPYAGAPCLAEHVLAGWKRSADFGRKRPGLPFWAKVPYAGAPCLAEHVLAGWQRKTELKILTICL
ncbi:hypothetical protein TY91_13720 [Secundilactobacillus collinoides]|uniref:Uncharacterized protein n=1 Tax=Secundilactobacillus collinoides TaxID=33960 RepID=A0A166G3F9_SECCO|nr:hypothetical protein TY91_13720 [Secundilactobacillus collinoides]